MLPSKIGVARKRAKIRVDKIAVFLSNSIFVRYEKANIVGTNHIANKNLKDQIVSPNNFIDHAAEGNTYWESLRSQYNQSRRWAWGVTDISYAIGEFWAKKKEISWINSFFRILRSLEQHLLWPANWFLLTLGAALPPLINPTFKYTALGFYLPRISGVILTLCTVFILAVIVVDWLLKPPRPKYFKKSFLPFTIIQFILLPVTGFLFGALPGMDAHTRLILGKRLEYQVTEKIGKK